MGTNTGIGIGIGIPFKNNALGGDRPYLPPELKARLIGVWDNYGKKNTDADRNIIKNKIPNAGGDLEILNAAYEGMSGYNGHPVIFGINKTWKEIPTYNSIYSINDNKIHITKVLSANKGLIFSYVKRNDQLYDITEIPSFKIRVSGLKGDSKVRYSYIKTENAVYQSLLDLDNGIHELPKSLVPTDSISNNSWIGFTITPRIENETGFDCDITIEILPEYEGAFVTDGVNDLITSTKTVQEMLGGSSEITVVSMIHQIGFISSRNYARNNYFIQGNDFLTNTISAIGKIGIYGYKGNLSNIAIVNDILGDKKDYSVDKANPANIDSVFSVNGTHSSAQLSQIAWYWTIIANKVLTTDQINQVIAYFNLDKYVKPDIYYNVKKQGLTNDTPDEDWYLKDFSGNGRDMTLYNYARTPESGINEEGGLQSDGVVDYGQFVGDLGLKDYTLIMNRAYNNLINNQVPLISSNIVEDQTPFIVEHWNTGSNAVSFSYGASRTTDIPLDINKKIVYQSTYSYMGYVIPKGNAISTGNGITLGKFGNGVQYSAICLWSLMLFPYSMSEFLIERQLKKHKLGTLYPNMVEFRPVIKSNASYDNIVFYYKNEKVENGTYLTVGSSVGMHIRLSSSPVNEIKSITVNGIPATFKFHDTNSNIYQYDFNLTSKSSQKINITIDEYIRYEDIVQPYPSIINLVSIDKTYFYTYGDKLKVGDVILYNSYKNLLKGLYSLNGRLKYNGVYIYDIDGRITVAKEMVFSWTVSPTYLLDNNEPKCILSPSRLRIPNSSYKLLGYIPDISGHGNHGIIHNSAYAEGSGVNEDGSYQFDGVDDFVTIPTAVGGKQVLMKVNWNSLNHVLYDQRNNAEAPFCIVTASGSIAYNQRNVGGNTYIDGILNNHILVDDLQAITHNIVLNNDYNVANSNSFIGTNYTKSVYAKMSLYDFMLFDEISTDDKIKELNEYVGIEAKVELPPYYWDTYGKTNFDADRDTIQQRGVAVGDYDLTNYNHAYEGMSGYNGYPVVLGANKTWKTSNAVDYIYDINSTTIHITRVKKAGVGLLFSYVKKDGALTNIREIPAFRVTVKGLEGNSKFGYRYLATEDATIETLVYLGNGTHELAKSFAPTEALLDLTRNAWVGIFITPMVEGELVFDCDITIEILPEYENGLAYDGVSDFTDNKNIPIFTDFTAIIKRIDLDAKNDNSTVMFKGNKIYESNIGNDFILDYCYNSKNYVYSYGKLNQIERDDSKIIYLTPESYNGNPIIKGENEDNLGLVLGKYWKGIIYKTILYSKTISLLEINFLKNLMEKDEIIDINHPIFISNTGDESNASQDT